MITSSTTTRAAFHNNGKVLVPNAQLRPMAISKLQGNSLNTPTMNLGSARNGTARFPNARVTQTKYSIGPAQPP